MISKLNKLQEYLVQEGFSKEARFLDQFILRVAQETYTVKSGDSIFKISGGDPLYQKMILDANPGLDPNKLQIGQKIKLPPKPKRPNENMSYSQSLIEFVKKFEGRPDEGHRGEPYLNAYDDGFGNITIGWGHNLGNVSKNQVPSISKSQAEEMLAKDLEEAAGFVRRNVAAPLSQYQFDALTSLTFNAGANAVYKTNLFKAVNEGNFETAAKLFPTTLVGANQGGLQIRRSEETAMFQSGVGSY
jgi:lysozyme